MATKKKQRSYSIAHARDQLPRIVHEAEDGATVTLTRRGRPVAVMISLDEYEQRRRHRGWTLWDSVQRLHAREDFEGVTEDELDSGTLRDRDPGRAVEV